MFIDRTVNLIAVRHVSNARPRAGPLVLELIVLNTRLYLIN